MALVAYGSSSGESDSEDEGPTITLNGVTHGGAKKPQALTPVSNTSKLKQNSSVSNQSINHDEGKSSMSLPSPNISENFLNEADTSSSSIKEPDFHISDDEEDFGGGTHDFLNEPKDEKETDIFKLISRKLPAVKHKLQEANSFVDKNEDTSDIVKKVDYGEKIQLPPSKKKKTERGPAKIGIPSLKELKEAETNAGALPVKPKITASKKGSGLMALLPDPTNKTTRRPLDKSRPETEEELKPVQKVNLMGLGGEPSKNNLKPVGVRKSGLVPHVLAKPVTISKPPAPPKEKEEKAPKNLLVGGYSDSDDEDEDMEGLNSGAYFPGPSVPDKYSGGLAARHNTAPEPEQVKPMYGLKRPPVPQPIVPADQNFISLDNADDLGPAVSVYPPPAHMVAAPGGSSLIDNEEAIARLAGKAAKRREFDDMKIIDINEDQMRGDPNVWLTKAMTEEQAPMPDRKAGPKGLAKSKHQITYLAHMAKEKDWELRQEWSQAKANKRASMNKYGFC